MVLVWHHSENRKVNALTCFTWKYCNILICLVQRVKSSFWHVLQCSAVLALGSNYPNSVFIRLDELYDFCGSFYNLKPSVFKIWKMALKAIPSLNPPPFPPHSLSWQDQLPSDHSIWEAWIHFWNANALFWRCRSGGESAIKRLKRRELN